MATGRGLGSKVTNDNAKWYALGAACFGLFMAILDNLVVNIAMPTIARDLDATTTQLQWIVSAYTLVFASLQITAGGLGDRFGRKRWFLIGLAVFTATSVLAAFSQSIEMLIAARAAQGVGAALIMPLSLSIISDAFPPEERGRAVGIWGAISVSGIALGPVVGGLLVEYASWHWVFLINLPIGIGAFFVASAVVRESRDESGTVATDIPGTVLITGAIAALTYGLIEAGEKGWDNTLVLFSFIAAILMGGLFVQVERTTERPMVPLRFFRSSTFTGANIDSFMISFLLAGVSFFLTLYQQFVHGYSAIKTGLGILPMVAAMMIFSPISGSLVGRVGARNLITFGMVVAGIGTGLLLLTGVDAPYISLLPGFVVMGFGMSFIWAPMTTAVLNSVESDKSGVASAVNGAIREIGTAFGIALLGTLANRTYQDYVAGNAEITALRNDPALTPLIDDIASGASKAGYYIRYLVEAVPDLQALPEELIASIQRVSSEGFMAGMDVAIVASSVGLIATGILSFFLIKDEVVNAVVEVAPSPASPEVQAAS